MKLTRPITTETQTTDNATFTSFDISRGERLIYAMSRKGLFYNCQLSYDLDISESTLSRWKAGNPMSVEHAVKLAHRLSVSLDWLVRGHVTEVTSEELPEASQDLQQAIRTYCLLTSPDQDIVSGICQRLARSNSVSNPVDLELVSCV